MKTLYRFYAEKTIELRVDRRKQPNVLRSMTYRGLRLGRIELLYAALEWKAEDAWVGVYWKSERRFSGRKRWSFWICLLPCLPLHFCFAAARPPVPDSERLYPR